MSPTTMNAIEQAEKVEAPEERAAALMAAMVASAKEDRTRALETRQEVEEKVRGAGRRVTVFLD